MGGGVRMEAAISFFVTVMAGMVFHLVCKFSELHFTSMTFLFGINSRRMLLTCPILPLRLAFYEVKRDKIAEKTFNLSHFAFTACIL